MSRTPSYSDIIARWSTMRDLAADCGVSYSAVASWKARNDIPTQHWAAVVASAKKREVPGITMTLLMRAINTQAGIGRPVKAENVATA